MRNGRPGRPPIDPADRKKNLTVRLTPLERESLEAKARSVGLTVTAYLRQAALSRPIPKPFSLTDSQALEQLRRLGSNLNQAAAHANLLRNEGQTANARLLVDALEALEAEIRALNQNAARLLAA